VVDDRKGKFIEFTRANLFAGRYDHSAAAPYGFRVWVDPFLKVEPCAYET